MTKGCPGVVWPVFSHRYIWFLFSSHQKTLVDVTLENSNIKDQIRNLQQTYTASMDKLREKQRQLDAAQVENKLLKIKVDTGAWISCSPFPPPLPSSSSLSFHHQLSHSDFSILFSVGFRRPSVANPAGSDLTALRGFLCSELSVQIGGTPYIPRWALLPRSQWPQLLRPHHGTALMY